MEDPEDRDRNKELANRLQRAAQELIEIESLLQSRHFDVRILCEFREVMDHVRLSAWAAQRCAEVPEKSQDREALFAVLTAERVSRATQLLKELDSNFDATMKCLGSEGIEEFFCNIASLHGRLNPLFRKQE